ncbi:hypothetical protein NE237_028046 [Protea cynaroides]|uniref:Uncharacterized protein n=1 Tax=Protea cynaroides TaxID=273540 RepID=A0A9Q0JSI0_9MAGN|nr:hypothetical protein NE237_028046 [Protea cynaroides]
MGIPSFYRWLVDKYPLAVEQVIKEVPSVVNGVRVPIDTSRPNPNGREFDNLYLDMNGIIHPCFHPEDQPAPKTYEEIFKNVFKYIDHIFSLIRPRKLLYMAIDGVAPRAKMNQQRARRFRTAKDAADEADEAGRLSNALEREMASLDELEQTKTLDSNVITPGTEFMASLSSALQYYIRLRMNTDPGWRGIEVILSDANVPGEGEHKVMSYIRLQRNLPGFDPNTRHCLYGLDADLIMLGLATHEVHFSILREDVSKGRIKDKKPTSGKWSSQRKLKRHCEKFTQSEVGSLNVNDGIAALQFQFLNIWILREYLAHEMKIPDRTVKADFERLIDDFVFMCLFVGNDFLPHMPSLEISEGAIDLLVAVYKKEFVRMGGYLTDSFEVNLERVQHFLQAVGSYESAIFRKRGQTQIGNRKHGRSSDSSKLPHAKRRKNSESLWSSSKIDEKKTLISISKEVSYDANAEVDKVKLGEKGWKERFYTEKFEAKSKDDQDKIRRDAVFKYIEGICWVMHYYYRGVCSWQWFYPYHYAPFASDFYGLGQLEIQFTLGEPFKPLNQLMSVLPAASAHALPLIYRALMTDSSSPISDFYPTDFELDMNGKRFAWQAVIKLPFIMESRLLEETAKLEHTLTDEEKRRNSLGMDILFIHISHPLTMKIFSLCEQKKDHPELHTDIEYTIDPKLSNGMNGYIYISDKPVLPLEIYSPIEDMEMITKNETISVCYKFPAFHPHIPRLPEGVLIPGKSIRSYDVSAPMLWHEKLAVFGRRSERPIPKSISGPSLAKVARRLVSEYYLMKQPNSKKTASEKNPDHGEQSCIIASVTADCTGYQPKSKAVVSEERPDRREQVCVGTKARKKRPRRRRKSIANVLVSESCPMKQQLGIVSTNLNAYVATDYIPCQPNSKDTGNNKRPGNGERNHINIDVTTDGLCHQNPKETVCEKVQLDYNDQSRINVDHGEQSCLNGSKSRKRKRVKKKHEYSIDKKQIKEHQRLQSPVPEKGLNHDEASSIKLTPVHEKGLNHDEASSIKLTPVHEKGQRIKECHRLQSPVPEKVLNHDEASSIKLTSVHEKGLNHEEASSIKPTRSQKKRRARRKAKALQSLQSLRSFQSQEAEEARTLKKSNQVLLSAMSDL